MGKVFVSYPRERVEEANDVKRALASAFVCHLDIQMTKAQRDKVGHVGWLDLLSREIHDSSVVLVLWDRNYCRAAWCAWELSVAVRCQGKPIILVNLDGSWIPPQVRDRVELATTLLGATELAQNPAEQRCEPIELESIVINPAASMLESRIAPRFHSRTRGGREIVIVISKLIASIMMQLLIYGFVRHFLRSDVNLHMLAILVSISISMTLINAVVLSLEASIRSGLLALICAVAVMLLAIGITGGLSRAAVTVGAAAMGTFCVSLNLFLREDLLGSLARRRPRRISGVSVSAGSLRRNFGAHVTVLLAIVGFLLLIMLGFHEVEVAIDLSRELDKLPWYETIPVATRILKTPVYLGLLVAFLVGVSLAFATYNRVLRNYRDTARHRKWVAVLFSVLACGVASGLGYLTGLWISTHVVEAVGSWGGGYAGAQIGIVFAVGVSLPVAAGGGRMSTRAEYWWAILSVIAAIFVVVLKIHQFPFAQRGGVQLDVISGAIVGFIPVSVLRLVGGRGVIILFGALLFHVAVLVGIQQDPSSKSDPRIERKIASTPVTVNLEFGAKTERRKRQPSPEEVVGSSNRTPGDQERTGSDRASPEEAHRRDRKRKPPAKSKAPSNVVEESIGSATIPDPDTGSAAQESNAGQDAGTGSGGEQTETVDSGAVPDPPQSVTIRCQEHGTMDVGLVYECDLGGLHNVTNVALSVGCNDGESGGFTLMFDEGSAIAINGFCNSSTAIPGVPTRIVRLRMNSGGGGDSHISFNCCTSSGWHITYE